MVYHAPDMGVHGGVEGEGEIPSNFRLVMPKPEGGEGGGHGRASREGKRRLLVAGALLSVIVLVVSLAAMVVVDDRGGSTVELAGKYDYGRYSGLAPDELHDRQVRETPHDLVYYNVFTDKAVKPHRWLSSENFRSVIRKMQGVVSEIQDESHPAEQAVINDKFLKQADSMEASTETFRQNVKEDYKMAEKQLTDAIMDGVKKAEDEGFAQLDAQKQKVTAELAKKAIALDRILSRQERENRSRLSGFDRVIAKSKEASNAKISEYNEKFSDFEAKLKELKESTERKIDGMTAKLGQGQNEFDAAKEALASQLLSVKDELSAEVDTSVLEIRTKITKLILELRTLMIAQLKESNNRLKNKLGESVLTCLSSLPTIHIT